MAKPSQHNKPWTKAEVTQLKKMYYKDTAGEFQFGIAELTNGWSQCRKW